MEVRPNKDGYSSLQKPNNKIDLRNKLAINLRRENPELKFNSGKFICLMHLPKLNELKLLRNYYECENAIGIEYTNNRKGNSTLINLGDGGNDTAYGLVDHKISF